MKKITKASLIVFGLIGFGIGGALLFTPISFEASAGIILENNSSLLSEIRAYGAVILVAGITILLGAFFSKLTYLSLIISTGFYLSIGFSRILSMFLDGIPSDSLMFATIAEIVIGLICILLLFFSQYSFSNSTE